MTYHIARWREGGRFLTLDSFAGSTSDPLTLHKYLYAHGDSVNGIDPSGLFSLGSTLGSINIGGALRGLNQSSIFRALHAVDRVLDFVETFNFFREIFQAVSGAPDVAAQLRRLQNIANLNAGNSSSDWRKLRGLTRDHIQAVVRELILEAPTILPRIVREHGDLLKSVSNQSTRKRIRRRPTLVIGLPSLPGRFQGAKLLTQAGTVGGLRLGFAVSKTGRGGSLFSVGFKFSNSNDIHQIFRVDYHGQGNPAFTTGSKAHGNAYLLGTLRGLGSHIAGVGRPHFHYHIPFSGF